MISYVKDWVWNIEIASSGFNDTDTIITLRGGERVKLADPASVGSYRMTCYNNKYAAAHLDPNCERIIITAFGVGSEELTISRNTNGQGAFTHNNAGETYYLGFSYGEELVTEINSDLALKANLISPSFTTPSLGNATCSSINKVIVTAVGTSATLTVANNKTLIVSNSVTLTAIDGATLVIGAGGALGTAAYTDSTAYLTADVIAIHAALVTGIHGLAITSGKILTIQDNVTITGALGTGAYANISNYALINSPTFTGTPLAPTAVADNNTTQIATTAYIIGQLSNSVPLIDSTANAGISLKISRYDHVHPSDITKISSDFIKSIHKDCTSGYNDIVFTTPFSDIVDTNYEAHIMAITSEGVDIGVSYPIVKAKNKITIWVSEACVVSVIAVANI